MHKYSNSSSDSDETTEITKKVIQTIFEIEQGRFPLNLTLKLGNSFTDHRYADGSDLNVIHRQLYDALVSGKCPSGLILDLSNNPLVPKIRDLESKHTDTIITANGIPDNEVELLKSLKPLKFEIKRKNKDKIVRFIEPIEFEI